MGPLPKALSSFLVQVLRLGFCNIQGLAGIAITGTITEGATYAVVQKSMHRGETMASHGVAAPLQQSHAPHAHSVQSRRHQSGLHFLHAPHCMPRP